MTRDRIERSFLVRLWRESGAERGAWRGSIDHLPTGERRYFTGLGALWAYLEAHAEGLSSDVTASGESGRNRT